MFGLHGLPLPPRTLIQAPEKPANVTPAVIATDYGISGVVPSGGTKMRQAVAEFQGQYMNATDLSTFFERLTDRSQCTLGTWPMGRGGA